MTVEKNAAVMSKNDDGTVESEQNNGRRRWFIYTQSNQAVRRTIGDAGCKVPSKMAKASILKSSPTYDVSARPEG